MAAREGQAREASEGVAVPGGCLGGAERLAARQGTTDVGGRVPGACGVIVQVRDGEFTRIRPKKPGTIRCDPKNIEEIELDLER